MFKKITSFFIIFCLAALMVPPQYAAAKTNENSISSNTIITEDNIYEVLEYLGLDSSKFIESDNAEDSGVTTVGELKMYIEQAKKETKKTKEGSNQNVAPYSANSLTTSLVSGSGTMMLYNSTDLSGCNISRSVAASYSNGWWTSANSASVDVSSSVPGVTQKIVSQRNNLSCSSFTITLNSYVLIDSYIGIGKVGIIPFNEFSVNSTIYWQSSDYIYGWIA